ncbi:MAG: glucose 1-dehydrogenase [bacterium]
MDLQIEGKWALITGAGQGMGRGIALALAAEGANVVINDIVPERAERTAEEVKKAGADSFAAPYDVSKYAEVKKMSAEISDRSVAIDILINCAGTGDETRFHESSEEDWVRVLGVCLMGTIYCARELMGGMMEKKWGRIVNIVSDAGRIGEPGLVVYSGAKAGIIGFTKALAKELGKYNITVNCISPGATLTDYIKEMYEKMKEKMGGEKFEQRQKKVLKKYPLGRLGEVEDVASAVVFLCSQRASFITGQTLSVSGGYTTL